MVFTKEIKKTMEEYPVLSMIGLTIAIWLCSFHLGEGIGEMIANIKNYLDSI
ncbi:hypothetical protein ACFYKX_05065 [Cytobacillus sp. FJAT-54145]|uniref:Uncharacterized protein n=1 Tax=Cytobacillus spartinae TaxID=3299023 RepID=A0ABW6KB80_9BACI